MCLSNMARLARTLPMLLLATVIQNVLSSIHWNNRGSRRVKRLCSLKPRYVHWDTIKTQLMATKLLGDVVDKDALSHSESYGSTIPIHWCHSEESTACHRYGFHCAPATLEKRSTALAVSAGSDRWLVSLEYLEATECHCKKDQPAVDVFPVIMKAAVAKPCNSSAEDDENASPVVADEGGNVSMSFHYFSPVEYDAPKSVMTLKAYDHTQPLVQNIFRRIENTPSHEPPEDWKTRSQLRFDIGRIELHLQNVTHADEGTFFCYVEFLTSSSCFSKVDLRVSGDIPETPENSCVPQMTKLTWPSLPQEISNDTALYQLVTEADNFNTTLSLHKCHSDSNQCQGTNRHCVSATTRVNQVTMCVPDEDGDEMAKLEVNYIEDKTCSCGLRNPFRPSETTSSEISVKSVERVGKCPKMCQPESVRILWLDLMEFLDQWTYLEFPSFIEGKDLWVKKCRQNLSPCNQPDMHCDVANEKVTRKVLKLENTKLVIKFLEARKCKCVEGKNLTYDLKEMKERPPTITYVTQRQYTKNRKASSDIDIREP